MKKLFLRISISLAILISLALMSGPHLENIQAKKTPYEIYQCRFQNSCLNVAMNRPTKEIIPQPKPVPDQFDAIILSDNLDNRAWTKFKYRLQIAITAKKYDIDPQLVYATIMTESEGDEFAYRYEPHLDESSLCLGQILVSTARRLGFQGNPHELYKPEVCIDLIGKYHRTMLDNYGDLTPQQLTQAYNTGSPWKRSVWGHMNRFNKWFYEESI